MKFIAALLFPLFYLIAHNSVGQLKKPVQKTKEKRVQGLLRAQDYEYYILVSRGLDSEKPEFKPFYTLSNVSSGNVGDFAGKNIVMDIRTGKEIAWWPKDGKNFYFKSYNLLCNYKDGNVSKVITFDTTGRFIRDLPIVSDKATPVLGATKLTLSTDWKRAASIYNSDLWLWDFDLASGKFSNPTQATQSGSMGSGPIYLKGTNAIVSKGNQTSSTSTIVDLKTGKYTDIGNHRWEEYNDYITDQFYTYATDKKGYWSILGQDFFPNSDRLKHFMWLDALQAKALVISYDKVPSVREDGFVKLMVLDVKSQTVKPLSTPYFSKQYATAFDRYKPGTAVYHTLSPNGTKIIFVPTNDPTGAVIIDLELGTETFTKIPLIKEKSTFLQANQIAWTDANHILFNAPVGVSFFEKVIDEASRGAYILDVQTGKAKKLLPFFINETNSTYVNQGLKVSPLKGSSHVTFLANNYLYKCKPDGTELSQVLKFPGLYRLEGAFLSEHPEIK